MKLIINKNSPPMPVNIVINIIGNDVVSKFTGKVPVIRFMIKSKIADNTVMTIAILPLIFKSCNRRLACAIAGMVVIYGKIVPAINQPINIFFMIHPTLHLYFIPFIT